jgi:hypothetical protein
MRWSRYHGIRIEAPGHRTSIELPPKVRFAPTVKRYGYVWNQGELFRAYVELLCPGRIVDLDLGVFPSARDARRAVEAALSHPLIESDDD